MLIGISEDAGFACLMRAWIWYGYGKGRWSFSTAVTIEALVAMVFDLVRVVADEALV